MPITTLGIKNYTDFILHFSYDNFISMCGQVDSDSQWYFYDKMYDKQAHIKILYQSLSCSSNYYTIYYIEYSGIIKSQRILNNYSV